MKDTNITSGNPLSDEVEVDLDVLGALMLNGVGGHVDGADVVAVDQSSSTKRDVKFLEKLSQPRRLYNSIGDSAILSLSTGARDGLLPLGRPRNQIITEEHGIARGGLTCVRTTSLVGVRVDHQLSRRRRSQEKPEMKSAPYVAQDPLESNEVWLSGFMHVEADLLRRCAGVLLVATAALAAATLGGLRLSAPGARAA